MKSNLASSSIFKNKKLVLGIGGFTFLSIAAVSIVLVNSISANKVVSESSSEINETTDFLNHETDEPIPDESILEIEEVEDSSEDLSVLEEIIEDDSDSSASNSVQKEYEPTSSSSEQTETENVISQEPEDTDPPHPYGTLKVLYYDSDSDSYVNNVQPGGSASIWVPLYEDESGINTIRLVFKDNTTGETISCSDFFEDTGSYPVPEYVREGVLLWRCDVTISLVQPYGIYDPYDVFISDNAGNTLTTEDAALPLTVWGGMTGRINVKEE